MQKVDLLIHCAYIVTMDADRRLIEDGAVAVDGSKIVAVGICEDILTQYHAEKVIDATGQVLMPGLINAHTHLAMTLFRGLADDLPLEPFLEKVWRAEGLFIRPETVDLGVRLAFAEMIRSGTTCAMDMYWYPHTAAEAASKAGFRLANGPVYVDFDGPDEIPIVERTAWGREFVQQYIDDDLIVPSIMPHAAYTVSKEYLQQAEALAEEYNLVLHTHASETIQEVQTVVERTGKTPPNYLNSIGLLSERTVLAHCVHLSEDEIELFAEKDVTVVHCPISNLKMASGFAPLPALRSAGVGVALGTDGTATGNDLDMWKVMRFAAVIHRGVNGDSTFNPAVDVVAMATRDGAQALGIGELTGSIEVGKCADLLLVDLNRPHLVPLYDVYSHLVYAVGRDDVRTVLINGKVVMLDRILMTIDEPGTLAEARDLAHQIRAQVPPGG